jgi:hypothetical protein
MTETDNQERIAFWLIPAEEETRLLEGIIHRLANQFHTPAFQPHLTLTTIPSDQIDNPETLLEHLAAKTTALALECSGTPIAGERYNQALILPYKLSAELTTIVSSLHPQHRVPPDYLPHVSLLYDNLDQESGLNLSREIQLERSTFHFNRISVIKIGPKTTSADDVLSWQTIATSRLREKES